MIPPLGVHAFVLSDMFYVLISSADPMNQVIDWVVESYKDAVEVIHGAGANLDVHDIEHLRQVKAQALGNGSGCCQLCGDTRSCRSQLFLVWSHGR